MWASPESRIAATSFWVSQASWPVVMATATPPCAAPMSSIIRRARAQRVELTAIWILRPSGGAGPSTISGSDREKPTAPTRWK